jgi:two-component system OmpR family sensor kinase/two-component system sensor histidine kinase BaeS
VNGQTVGTLVIPTLSPFGRLGIARAVIFPVSIISLLLSIFLIIISTLLVQRYINPLADVIFAAREMSRGKLSTRIAGTGPQDLRSLSDSFNEMAASLERNDRERREMLADIAHELRTPLSVIRGRLEGIVDGIYQDNGTQVSMALEQTYLLERLVDDLRLLTLAETRQLQFDKTDVQISELIQKVVDIFSAEAAEKGIALSFNNNSKAKTFPVDPQRLEQVISNLIGNALRYIPNNGKITITTKDSTNGINITVSDNGTGIPEADLPFIFDRFWRKDRSRSRSSGGTGLGLAIAKQLIEAQGGSIQAKNNPEGGLHVEIELKN